MIYGKVAVTVAIPLKHEIPGQNKVIPGSLDKLLESVKSLDCPGHPWTVGNSEKANIMSVGGGEGGRETL